ncbi:hypothetical protein PHYSODRAFT_338429 [Phytophthora sojae]|uniref:Uncharacterized protein n=1 Tax=Phytophthora sojae (strain P6497) TaxID=1094619 RepID=G5A4R3_PHYSP|nr:hypothetical protein PHYSODRAFT_338429 [Phytophthora sojae]EGZ09663.1 hypothetical protein PHYSODRAFT_338429 [Phytophthora sojae]|eukprot:XP_009534524.1 hypothetical protein PHYSODRAFT_338429 [Phytophthora sojae]
MQSPAFARSALPPATADHDVEAPPSASPLATANLDGPSMLPPGAATPAAPADSECAAALAQIVDVVAAAGEDSDADSGLDEEMVRVWEELELTSRSPGLGSPDSGSASPALPAPREVVASAGGFSPPTRLQELVFMLDVEGLSVEEAIAAEPALGATFEASPQDESGLFDDSDDDEGLPQNHYDPKKPWDYNTEVNIVRALDVRGKAPHRGYLVEWEGNPLQLSWVWMEQLDKPSTRYMMRMVDARKESGDKRTFCYWYSERDSASEAGTCFMDAFRSALYYLGQPDLVTMEMWDAYEDTRPEAIQYGVSRDDVTEFFKVLQRKSVPLNYDVLHRNALPESSANITTLQGVCRKQAPGVYVVSAGRHDVGHCFVVVSRGPEKQLLALDNFNARKNPPWIQHVKWMAQVELQPGYKCRHGKRKSKTQKKREKRMKQQVLQQEGM